MKQKPVFLKHGDLVIVIDVRGPQGNEAPCGRDYAGSDRMVPPAPPSVGPTEGAQAAVS